MTDIDERLRTALADHYRIERELGAGGMATVYLAEDLKHHRKVAIREIGGAEKSHGEIGSECTFLVTADRVY